MQIILNGNNHILEDRITLDDLLKKIYISNNKIAIAINNEIIPRSNYLHTWLKENDNVEIVTAFQGG